MVLNTYENKVMYTNLQRIETMHSHIYIYIYIYIYDSCDGLRDGVIRYNDLVLVFELQAKRLQLTYIKGDDASKYQDSETT